MSFFLSIRDYLRTLNNERRARRLVSQQCRVINQGFLFSGRSQYFTAQGYEPHQTELVKRVLTEVDSFVNVGAHHGYYCCLALQRGKETIAFEPHPMNIVMLRKHIAANRFSEKFRLFEAAVGSSKGSLEFYGGGFTGSLLNTIHVDTPTHERQLVDVVTLDSALNIGTSKALILMDVEGYELEALKGASNLLRQRHYWLVEILSNHGSNYPYSGVFDLMETNGYEAWGVDEVNQDFEKITLEKAIEIDSGKRKTAITNYLFIPRGEKLVQNLQEPQKD